MRLLTLCLLLGAMASGCTRNNTRSAPRAAPPLVVFQAGGQAVRVRVEVVRTPKARSRGLMYRRELGADEGMLFVFDRQQRQSFWMKNTYLPLDMIFIDEQLKVVGVVADAEPLTTTSRAIDAPSRYVVEVNGGFARAHEITVGTPVRIEGVEEIPAPPKS